MYAGSGVLDVDNIVDDVAIELVPIALVPIDALNL